MKTDAENTQVKLIEELAEFRRLRECVKNKGAITACLLVRQDSACTS